MENQTVKMKDYLVEMVYKGKLHEPFGVYHGTSFGKVVDSLKEEVDSKGYTEEYGNGMYKFISPNNLPSYWVVHEYLG